MARICKINQASKEDGENVFLKKAPDPDGPCGLARGGTDRGQMALTHAHRMLGGYSMVTQSEVLGVNLA